MKKNELLTKDINTLIKQIAIPSSIGMFFNTMYNVVDTFYVGMISTVAITALSYSFMVFFMILSISMGLSSAITAHVGNSLGKHKHKLSQIYVANGITFIASVSILLSFLGYLFLPEIFTLLGARDESLKLSLEYTNVILIGTVPMLIGMGANAALIAKGDTKSYRNTLVFGFVLNLILNPLFIYGYGIIPTFGFEGVAYATVLIQFLTFFYILFKLYKTDLLSFKIPKMFFPDIRIYKQLFTQALPMSLNMFTMSLGTMLIMYFVSFYGYKTVAAFGIGYRVEQIILLPMLGLNTAVSAIVANNYGAKNFDRITEVIHKALKYGFIMATIGIVFLFFFGKYIIMAFDTNIEVIETAYTYVMIESIIFFAFITIFISNSTLQGIKQPFIIPYVSMYRQIIMPVILLYIGVVYFECTVTTAWILIGIIIYSAAIWIYIYMKNKLKELKIKI
ncbi:MATE family efflux transporter [Arcobacteraceae bacterium]|nr:MATE family efflux transporter [Arcobacteraceae bacterium]